MKNQNQNYPTSQKILEDKGCFQFRKWKLIMKKHGLAQNGLLYHIAEGQYLESYNFGWELHLSLHTCGEVTTCVRITWQNFIGNFTEIHMAYLHLE